LFQASAKVGAVATSWSKRLQGGREVALVHGRDALQHGQVGHGVAVGDPDRPDGLLQLGRLARRLGLPQPVEQPGQAAIRLVGEGRPHRQREPQPEPRHPAPHRRIMKPAGGQGKAALRRRRG